MSTVTAPPVAHKPEIKEEESTALISRGVRARPLFDPEILRRAAKQSFVNLDPRVVAKNPVMFVVEVGAALTTIYVIKDAISGAGGTMFGVQIALWLWFTVLFANFAEAMAEARGKAQADTLRKTKTDTMARKILPNDKFEMVPASKLRAGDIVYCEAGYLIPGDGEVIEGIASVDESVITGESAPVIRESGGDRSAVTGGTKVLSDHIKIQITSNPGETFLDRMIALVEGAVRQKTPNEIALNILIAGLTLIFLLAVSTLPPYALYAISSVGAGMAPSVPVLVSLLVCLIPTTIGGLLSAIGIAGMDRVMQHNVLAMSGKAVEASGDVNTLLLDKTGTITLGNRQAVEFITVNGVSESELADAAQLSSLADETPEGRSIVVLAKEKYKLRGREVAAHEAHFIPFSAYTRMSGVDIDGRQLRKGATDAVARFIKDQGGSVPPPLLEVSDRISRSGGTPLAVADSRKALGLVHLKDIVKGGMKERLAALRAMGIRSVMITGDNPLTAAAIAQEAGVDDFLSQATPKDKLDYIVKEQAQGRLVAMTGDGTNDAPALAQADVGVAMNTASGIHVQHEFPRHGNRHHRPGALRRQNPLVQPQSPLR
jgi:K+-transporting ATPase ATPase B chain